MWKRNEAKLDSFVKLAAIIGALVTAFAALGAAVQYRYAPEREFRKTFLDRQLSTAVEVFNAVAAIDAASTDVERKAAVDRWWVLYHGNARAFLDREMYAELTPFRDYVAVCVAKAHKRVQVDCNNTVGSMLISGFAREVRSSLGRNWGLSLPEIAKEDPMLAGAKP